MIEKKLSEITLRLEEGLKRDLQDMAAHEDRSLSDVIRIILELHIYGAKARADELCARVDSGKALRGTR